jgi:hypothetical protein
MADKKSILEEALLDIKNIQSALNANTKEILRSVAKEEINGVVKESLISEIYEEEELELEPAEMGGEEEGSEEEGLGDIESSEEEPEMDSELGMDTDVLGGAEMDMTAASDDDVIAIYKKLSGEDEIEIVGDEIHLNISEPGEYIVKTGGVEAEEEELELEPAEMGGEEEESDDVEYEIEMGDEEEENEIPDDLVPADEEGEEGEEEEGFEDEISEKISIGTGMSVGTHRNKTGAGSIGAQENPKSVNESAKAKQLVSETTKKYNTLLTEAKKLKTENEEFRSALREFRTKLVETVVFNSNLTYVTKLFLEHSTTKAEKDVVIKRFDEATNLKESKKLYKTIGTELESRKPMNESVESKIIKEATTSTSKQLNESTAYVDPSTKRIMDLINRVEKR